MSVAIAEQVKVSPTGLGGDLVVPAQATGVVLFAHGSGSSRHSPRNRYVASSLQQGGFATLLLDLLTAPEERVDQDNGHLHNGHLRFDIGLLGKSLLAAT